MLVCPVEGVFVDIGVLFGIFLVWSDDCCVFLHQNPVVQDNQVWLLLMTRVFFIFHLAKGLSTQIS